MQSYQGQELVETTTGTIVELAERAREIPQATHHVIGHFPQRGDELTINGLVWVVSKVNAQHGWLRLNLKK